MQLHVHVITYNYTQLQVVTCNYTITHNYKSLHAIT